MMDHSEQIFKSMEIRQCNVAMLSRLTGIPKIMLWAILRKDRAMTVVNACRIAKVLKNVTAKELLIGQVEYQLAQAAAKKKSRVV